MSDIFLSYASEDRERVRPLVEALKQEGWTVFWDFTIPAGMTWRRFLLEKLENTRSLVVVWSKHSIESEWVMEETDEAKRQKKPIIPVLLDKVSPPFGYRAIHCRNLSDWVGSLTSPIFLHLVQDIKNSVGQPGESEKIATPPPEAEPERDKPTRPQRKPFERPTEDKFTNSLGMKFVLVPPVTVR